MRMCSDVRFLKSCAVSSRNPLSISEMLPEVRLNTPITTFLSPLLLVYALSFQAGLEGAGWQNSPGEQWWYKLARTAAPTRHQTAASAAPSSEGYPDQPASSSCSLCAAMAALTAGACLPWAWPWLLEQLLPLLLLLFSSLYPYQGGSGCWDSVGAVCQVERQRQVLLGGRSPGCGRGRACSVPGGPEPPTLSCLKGKLGFEISCQIQSIPPTRDKMEGAQP